MADEESVVTTSPSVTGAWYMASVQLNTRYGTLVNTMAKDVNPIIRFNHHIYILAIDINGRQTAGHMARVDEEGNIHFRKK